MLDGSFTAKVDEKGRVKIPADFRRELHQKYGSDGFFVTSLNGDCVIIYPSRVWETIKENLGKEPPSKKPILKYRRATAFFGKRASIDPQGRVLIHPRLRVEAGIEDEVLIIGHPNRLEVWDVGRFRASLDSDPLSPEDEDYLARFGI